MADFIANGAIAIHMVWSRLFLRRPLLNAARDAQATQRDLLAHILRENADTEFGLEHDFASVSGVGDYRKKVPVQSYGMLEPYVLRQQDGVRALTAAPPAYYARTSGTTGRSKDIPLTRDGLRQVKIAQAPRPAAATDPFRPCWKENFCYPTAHSRCRMSRRNTKSTRWPHWPRTM
jgi:hypothetical protein